MPISLSPMDSGYDDNTGDFLLGLAVALPISLMLWTIIIIALAAGINAGTNA